MFDRIIIGLIVIFLGTVFLLKNLIGFPAEEFFYTFWPIILILIAVISMVKHRKLNTGALILLFIGIWFQLRALHLIPNSLSQSIWPLFIIFVGILIISRPHRHYKYTLVSNSEDSDYIDYSKSFTEYSTVNSSNNFKGGNLSITFGELNLDLSNMKIAGDTAVLNVSAVLGEIDLKIPTDCRLRMDSSHVIGTCESSAMNSTAMNSTADTNLPLLHLKCSAVLGSITVHN